MPFSSSRQTSLTTNASRVTVHEVGRLSRGMTTTTPQQALQQKKNNRNQQQMAKQATRPSAIANQQQTNKQVKLAATTEARQHTSEKAIKPRQIARE